MYSHIGTSFSASIHAKTRESFRTWLKVYRTDIDCGSHIVIPYEFMFAAIGIFQDLFFFGHLPFMNFHWNEQLAERRRAYGVCKVNHTGHQSAAIEMGPVMIAPDCNGRTASLIGTLLHELVHAFLEYYSCDGFDCGQRECAVEVVDAYTRVGHGPAWQKLAAAIEEKCTSWLGFPVQLGWQGEGKHFEEDCRVVPFVSDAYV